MAGLDVAWCGRYSSLHCQTLIGSRLRYPGPVALADWFDGFFARRGTPAKKPTYFFNFEARVDLNAVPEFPCEVLFPLPARPASNRDMPGFGALSKMQLARYRWSCEEPVGIEQMLD